MYFIRLFEKIFLQLHNVAKIPLNYVETCPNIAQMQPPETACTGKNCASFGQSHYTIIYKFYAYMQTHINPHYVKILRVKKRFQDYIV